MITKTFTDIHGQTHTDAVIEVIYANFNCNQNSSFRLSDVDGNFVNGEISENSNSNSNLTFKAVFWDTEQDRLDGIVPKQVMSTHHMTFDNSGVTQQGAKPFDRYDTFEINNLPDDVYPTLDIVGKAEKFLTDHL